MMRAVQERVGFGGGLCGKTMALFLEVPYFGAPGGHIIRPMQMMLHDMIATQPVPRETMLCFFSFMLYTCLLKIF